MDEFALIGKVVNCLGDRARGAWVALGPGDDAAVISQTPGHQNVASIDTLVGGVHFPLDADAELVGYRALMVSLSDLAAMAATPRYLLVALTLPEADVAWCESLAYGMRTAAEASDAYICGGNFARGPLSITVSVHGEVPEGAALARSGAQVGDGLYVSGDLGGAAACVRHADWAIDGMLNTRQQRYFRPQARFDLQAELRSSATAAIDISDGLLADLAHLCEASGVGAALRAADIPVCDGAQQADALTGGDDYQILATSPVALAGMQHIGEIQSDEGVFLDGQKLVVAGYNHFGA